MYFATDGDNVGQRHARALLSDNVDSISEVSGSITHANEMIRDFVESNGGRVVSFGGDEGLFEAPAEFVELLEQLRKDYEYMVGATLSVGYGFKPSEAAKALLEAKETGKDKIVQYSESSEQHSQNIQEHRNSEINQEQVVGESADNTEPHQESQGGYANEVASDGITRDDPPSYDNNRGYDSGYKDSSKEDRGDSYRADDLTPPIIAKPNLTPKNPVAEATSGDVPETSRPMNNVEANPGEQSPEDKKPVSKYYDGQAEWIKPDKDEDGAPQSMADATNENRPSDLKYMRHGQQEQQADQPTEDSTTNVAEEGMAQDMGTEGTQQPTPIEETGQHCPSCTCDEHSQNDQPMDQVMDQHIDNATDYTNTIGEGGDGGNQDSADEGDSIEDILDQHLDNAADMAQNGDVNSEGMDPNGISRPEDYNAKQGDLGLSEEDAQNQDPNLDEVLRDGLDSHADSIQREKVVDMVGQALDAFKGQKQILDKAKEQAPELYDACIQMLRSMIELCSLAGIDQSQPEQDVNEIEGQGASPEEASGSQEMPQQGAPESDDSCPNCGHGKEKPATPQGKPEATPVGSVKKLPTKHSTPHIAKEPLPEGGVNAHGQKKHTDPTTGKAAFIDMKVGRVKGPRGLPVKG